MNSRTYIPQTGDLKNLVPAIWQTEGFTAFHKQHIIPQGVVEVIFNFSEGAPISAQLGRNQYRLPNCFINGFNRTRVEIQLPPEQKFFGARLQPLAVKKVFGVPAREFTDLVVDLTLVDPSIHSLWHQLAAQTNFEERVNIFSAWIQQKLHDWQPQEKLVNNFLSAIDQHDLSVPELAGVLCYSPRHLSRKLFEATGMNTEDILLYKKYLHAVHLIHHTDFSLTAIAYQSHFSDQSHFIRAFRTYSDITPGEYKRSKSYVKGHIYENVR